MMGWEDREYNREMDGGSIGFAPARGRSVTFWLIVINVAVFVIDAVIGRGMGNLNPIGNGPLTEWGEFSAYTLMHGQVWRLLTFQFLHSGLLHIFFNMWALVFFGRMIETHLGPRRYLVFFLLCGLGGAALYMAIWGLTRLAPMPHIPFLIFEDPRTPMVGASAGIFGLLMAGAFVAPFQPVSLLFPPVTLRLRTMAYILVGISLFMLMVGSPNAGGEAAHLGGALIGAFLIRRIHWLSVADWFRLPKGMVKTPLERAAARRAAELEEANREQAEVDRILDKVKQHGLHSLSNREKKTLQQATDRQRRAG